MKKFTVPTQLDAIAAALNSRTPREKMVILGCASLLLFTAFFLYWVNPTIADFTKTLPELSALNKELKVMREDKGNADNIKAQWEKAKVDLAEKEVILVHSSEISPILENLSKLAADARIKITSLKPMPAGTAAKGIVYLPAQIQLNAVAGTHDFGKFLAELENGKTFFRIENLRMASNPIDDKRHLIDLMLVAYRKSE